jgi:stage III sporulation protein AB
MLFKIIGSLIVITACSFLGFVFSISYSKRPQEIRELQVMLKMLENEIVYMQNLLEDAFIKIGKASKSKTKVFLIECVKLLKKGKGMNVSLAWEQAIKENIRLTSLNQEDGSILISFGKMLGKSDKEGQVKNIALLENQLNVQEKKAEEARKKNEGMYGWLGVLCGFAIVILLF